jgi:hypothetical protein
MSDIPEPFVVFTLHPEEEQPGGRCEVRLLRLYSSQSAYLLSRLNECWLDPSCAGVIYIEPPPRRILARLDFSMTEIVIIVFPDLITRGRAFSFPRGGTIIATADLIERLATNFIPSA